MGNKQRLFDSLARQYTTDLYRYALWLCKDPTLANDLVQETFTRAWKSIDSLREPGAAKGWLTIILRREHARLYERKRLEMADWDESLVAEDSQAGPEERNEIVILRRAMMALDKKYREPLVLQVLGGFSCAEIATKLDLTKAAVMTQLFRARQKLKQALRPEQESGTVHELY